MNNLSTKAKKAVSNRDTLTKADKAVKLLDEFNGFFQQQGCDAQRLRQAVGFLSNELVQVALDKKKRKHESMEEAMEEAAQSLSETFDHQWTPRWIVQAPANPKQSAKSAKKPSSQTSQALRSYDADGSVQNLQEVLQHMGYKVDTLVKRPADSVEGKIVELGKDNTRILLDSGETKWVESNSFLTGEWKIMKEVKEQTLCKEWPKHTPWLSQEMQCQIMKGKVIAAMQLQMSETKYQQCFKTLELYKNPKAICVSKGYQKNQLTLPLWTPKVSVTEKPSSAGDLCLGQFGNFKVYITPITKLKDDMQPGEGFVNLAWLIPRVQEDWVMEVGHSQTWCGIYRYL